MRHDVRTAFTQSGQDKVVPLTQGEIATPAASHRAWLLSSCSGVAVLALLLSGQPARAQTQTTCDTSWGGCYVSNTAPNGPAPSKPDFDRSGHNGNPGTAGISLNIDLSQTGSNYYYADDTTPAVALVTQAGSGSDGTDASNNDVGPVPNLSAGDGGAAGAAGSITLTMPQGSNILIVSGIDNLGNNIAGAPAIQLYAGGGNGGGGGVPTQGGHAGVSQPGAAGGDITINAYANPNQTEPAFGATGAIQSTQTGILAQSIAGNGGSGHPHVTDYAKQGIDGATTEANNGASNGPGGTIIINLGTSVVAFTDFGQGWGASDNTPGAGIWAISAGGNGGNGGTGSSKTDGGSGGDGGNAAPGGTIQINLYAGSSVTALTGSYFTPAIWAQSLGGIGGLAADESGWASGGNAGAGGNGGAIAIMNNGAITTASADHAPGILAQSFGGTGQSGGTGGGWGASGGEGASGGNGGSITITGTGNITTSSTNSPGILAQSIGGGGGSGGNDRGWLAVGGAGAVGGNGGTIDINYGGRIQTSAELSSGVVAQSIGGGGGSGGDASGSGLGLNLVVGGTGAGGGTGGTIQATNAGAITTTGSHSSGMLLQSVGGGGGSGGAAYSQATSLGGSASVALGGIGGGGGDGQTIGFASGASTSNSGSIVTAGNDSFGIVAQSIGGGGGIGGAAAAKATTYSVPGNDDIPSVALSVSLAGSGGTAGGGGSVTLDNAGLVATRGAGSSAMVAQSIGGGGGAGGDSSAHASAQGSSSFNLTGTVSFGGKGGGGGDGSSVTVSNNGLIITSGESADGILAQSIGGGGGAGGSGDGQAKATGDAPDITVTLNMGGVGGGGGITNEVTVTNNGAILTLGDGATGIMAQAVGGGGGRGGGAAGTSSSTYSATVNIGANGGKGGGNANGADGNAVHVTTGQGSAILTFGASAPGIVAQSIAGGGGAGGKAASTIGHTTSTTDGGNGAAGTLDTAYTSISMALARSGAATLTQYNSVQALANLAQQLVTGSTASASLRLGDDADTLDSLGGETGENEDNSDATSITVNVAVGGQGGSGGSAGQVTVMNNGDIGTVGAMSDGILAQSIGGGGGTGGAAISSTTSGDVQGAIGVGGNGGGAGNGASVTVTNNGAISTVGGMSMGIVAQSIAGGGGIAGTSAAKVKPDGSSDSSVLSVPISIGANGGGGGTLNGTTVTVTNTGSIETRSHDAIGIVAQSIQGGGGIVRTRSSDNADNNGGHAVATGGSYGINLTFGGSGGTPAGSDTAGQVVVTHTGSLSTAGRNAYGILAQSVGGGGGLVLGGTPNGTNFFGSGTMHGSADSVTVTAGNTTGAAGTAGNIATTGIGGIAIFAQSVGGGGGIAGDTGLTAQRWGFTQSAAHNGNGGSVSVTVNQSATLSTTANNTPVILAQSVGGGGGRVTNDGYGAYDGTAGGTGSGGTVGVLVAGQVLASGAASPGIFAESVGQVTSTNPTGGAAVRIDVLPGGIVQGGTDFNPGDGYGAGIYIVGGSTNQNPTTQTNNNINNQGTITSLGGTGAYGTAIYSTGGWTSVYNQAGGTITGSISLDNGSGGGACEIGVTCAVGGTVTNHAGATINSGAVVSLGSTGTLTNHGTINIGGTGGIATTAMTGHLVQGSNGRLVVDTNHTTGQADRLEVQGSVQLAGTVEVHPVTMANRAVTVLTASDGVNVDAGLHATRMQLFRFETQAQGNSLLIQPHAEFTQQAAGLGQNQQRVAAHLQELWRSGSDLGSGFTALANVADAGSYARALNSLSGQTIGAIAVFRYSASQSFVTTMLDGCPTYEQAGITDEEDNCGWARIFGRATDQNATADSLGYRADAWTMQTGAQVRVAPNWFLGGSIAYESSDFRGDGGIAKVNGDSLLLGATLRYQSGPWQISGAVDFGYGWYDSTRTVEVGSLVQQAKASPRAWQMGAHTRLAYQIPFEGWYLQPRMDLHLNHVRSAGYTESGAAPFNLTVDGQSATGFATTPAMEIGGRVPLGDGMVLRPYASAGISLLSNGDWDATARFAGQPASHGFRASTPMPDVLGKFTAGAELLSSGNWDFKLQYSADVGDGYVSHTGVGRIAYRF